VKFGGQIEIPDEHHTILGLFFNQKNIDQDYKSHKTGCFICFASLLQIFPQNFKFKRLIPLEKIKIADIIIILERSQKRVIDKIEVKMLGKNQNGTT
jgi:hypothetical protein